MSRFKIFEKFVGSPCLSQFKLLSYSKRIFHEFRKMFAANRITFIKNLFLRKMTTQKASTTLTIHKRLENLRSIFQTEEENGDVVPIFKKSLLNAEQIAIKDPNIEYSYQQIYIASKKLSTQISNICGSGASLKIGVLCNNDSLLPITQWGCWMSGQIFVPLLHKLPYEKLNYIIKDSNAKLLIGASHYEKMAKQFAEKFDIPLIIIDHNFIPEHNSSPNFLEKFILTVGEKVFVEGTLNNDFYTNSVAMLVYNNDRFVKPKGCIITHQNLQSRIKIISKAWNYKQNDYLLNLLPVDYSTYSVHSMMCLLSAGGKVSFYSDLDYHHIWSRMLGVNVPTKDRPNLLTALPSTYIKISQEYNKIFSKDYRMSEYIKSYCSQNFRLMISGPLPLPKNIFHYWNKITGHNLLRHYEIPETGCIISNPYIEDNQLKRNQNSIGIQLPQTNIRIVNSEGEILLKNVHSSGDTENPNSLKNVIFNDEAKPLVGELQVSGPTVFKGYFNEDTNKYFKDNFFKTGVIVSFENGVFTLLGHNDDDIVKIAGRSLSSGDIESLLHTHPNIKDAAVVSVSHTLWNEQICALCVVEAGVNLDLENIRAFCAKWLPSYMCPDILQIVPHIIRDSVGNINKKELTKLYFL